MKRIGLNARVWRRGLTVIVATVLSAGPDSLLRGQNPAAQPASSAADASGASGFAYLNRSAFPEVFNAYSPVSVPAPSMTNSELLHTLIRDDKLELSLADALALALENNLDIQVTRYVLADAQTDLLRAKGGGSIVGFNGVTQTGTTSAASGTVTGTVAQSGTSSLATASVGGTSSSSNSIGTSCCDPVVSLGFTWDRLSQPLNYTAVTGASQITNQTTNLQGFYSQGFLTGTQFDVGVFGNRQSTTAPASLLNPVVPTTMVIQVTQPLLKGFGYRANAVALRVARNGLKVADSVFRQQVMVTVTQVANNYYDLINSYQDLAVARKGLADAEQGVKDNQKEANLGVIAKFDVLRAQNEAAIRRQQVVLEETAYRQQQELLKTAISRQNADPLLSKVEIVPTDQLPEPSPNDLPPLEDALPTALANREELIQQELGLRDQDLLVKQTRNALLPSVNLFASYLPEGLAGNSAILSCPPGSTLSNGECLPDNGGAGFAPEVVGVQAAGIWQSLTQAFQGHFPEYNFGVNVTLPLRNRVAQATAARALLDERRMQSQLQQERNLVVQDVRTAEVNVSEARAAVEVDHEATTLAQQQLDGERQMFRLGKADYFFVTQAQDQLIAAQGAELQARDNYAKALAQFAEATATTLERYRIRMDEAKQGHVAHRAAAPPAP